MDFNRFFIRLRGIYKKLRYTYRLNSFYLYNGPGPSILGRFLNLIFSQVLLVLVTYIWFLSRLRGPRAALLLTIVLTVLLNLAYWLKRKEQIRKKGALRRRDLARDYTLDRLIKMGSEEFKWQILRLVLKIPGSSNIKVKDRYLETRIKGRKIAIAYYNDRFSEDLSPKLLSSFVNKIKAAGYEEAIFLTTGLYSEKSRDYVNRINRLKLRLLDKQDMLDLMEGLEMLADEDLIDGLVKKRIEQAGPDFARIRKEILRPRRTRTYLGYALFFTLASLVINSFKLYYLIFAGLFILLALVSWFRSRIRPRPASKGFSLIDDLLA
jgi:hypothetical protein